MSSAPPYGIAPPGHRLPDATRVGAVRLQVADLERSLRYYREVLGLQVLSRESGLALLGPHGASRPLLELRERRGARPVRPMSRLGLYHFAILLPDRSGLGRFLTHLANLGIRAGSADHLVSEALYLTDPDGLGIEVYADRPRAQWQVRGRELAMATDPLDRDSLVRAGGAEPWLGMPAGTVVGHVHLHVGELEPARAFYHLALGLDLMVWGYPGALFLAAGGYHHHLGINVWAGEVPPAGEDEARLLEWELLLPDEGSVAGAATSLVTAGHEPASGGRDPVFSDPVFGDPWGCRLRLSVAPSGDPA